MTDFTIGRCNFVERFTKIHGSMLPPKVSTLKGLRRSRENPQREENLRGYNRLDGRGIYIIRTVSLIDRSRIFLLKKDGISFDFI